VRSAIRWIVAGGVGAASALALFAAMAASIEGVDIVERLFRIFPLTQTVLPDTDECGADGTASHLAVPIEGVVGHLRDDGMAPLPDATVVGENAITGTMPVDVSSNGTFRFVAAFPNDEPSACRDAESVTEGAPQQLVVRAPGCAERIVPVTAAWVPHTVLLDCAGRD
jgi:hypothetical protein